MTHDLQLCMSVASCRSFSSSPRVVLVKNRSSWGSGVLVSSDPALVLTCSHVVRAARTGERIYSVSMFLSVCIHSVSISKLSTQCIRNTVSFSVHVSTTSEFQSMWIVSE